MAKGSIYPSESSSWAQTHAHGTVRQVTSHPSIHHHPFFYIPAYDDEMTRLIFISHRTGRPEIFAETGASARLLQLTQHDSLSEWSITPSHDGRHVYFTDDSGAWRVHTDSLREERLADFGDAEIREKGMVAAAMGTTALSYDDDWWAIPVKTGDLTRFVLIDTRSGSQQVILECDQIGHPEFHPSDSNLLRYAGPYDNRLWVINRDGSDNRLVYRRNSERREWIVHETWNPASRELLAVNWPHGMIGVDIDSGEVRSVTAFSAWHPMINRQGSLMVADTNFPDTGLYCFDPSDRVGKPRRLCASRSSNVGAHWNTSHCPYDDGPVQVYAPQHTHPHPCFSPDDRRVVFTSDRTGHAQIYECVVDESSLKERAGE